LLSWGSLLVFLRLPFLIILKNLALYCCSPANAVLI
jgi:hypothetical protein